MSAAELWKLNLIFLDQPDDVGISQTDEMHLLFISEKRLGFGTHGASKNCQRFSYATTTGSSGSGMVRFPAACTAWAPLLVPAPAESRQGGYGKKHSRAQIISRNKYAYAHMMLC